MTSLRRALPVLLFTVSHLTRANAAVPVTVGLRTSWPAHNLLLEILETAALDQPQSFFPLVDLLTSPDTFPEPLGKLSPEAIHQAALALFQHHGFFTHDTLKQFELALSLHVSAPKLEAFYQFYNDRNLENIRLPNGYISDGDGCGSWIDWYGSRLCSSEDLHAVLSREALDAASGQSATPPKKAKLLPFDHIYPDPATTVFAPPRTAILYADLTSPNFLDLHKTLMESAAAFPPKIQYVFRHVPAPKVVPPKGESPAPVKQQYLTGYGVGLDLKKMDYLALDDRRSRNSANNDIKDVAIEENAPLVDIVREILNSLPSSSSEPLNLTAPLTKEEFQYLGVQATSLILQSQNPLDTFIQLAENFPLYATELARKVDINGELQFEMAFNSRRVPKGMSLLWLNGKPIEDMSSFNPFNVLNMLRSERTIMEGLTSLGLTSTQALEALAGQPVAESFSQGNLFDGIFDASDRPEGGDVILWLNDLQKDDAYKAWPKGIESLLTPIYPGSFHTLGINLWNVVLAVDLSNRDSLIWIFKHVSNIINKKFPFTWGIVPLVDTPEGAKAARIFNYVHKHYGPKETMDFIRSLIAAQSEGETIDFLIANAFFNNLGINVKPLLQIELDESVSHDYDTVLAGQEPHSVERLAKAERWAKRMDVQSRKWELGHVFLNGKHFPLDTNFLVSLQREVGLQTQYLQTEVQVGRLSSNQPVDMSTYFYDLPSTPKRRNRFLFPDPETSPLRVERLDTLFRTSGFEWPNEDLLYPEGTESLLATVWVIGDLDDSIARGMATEAMKALDVEKNFRLGFIHAPRTLPFSDTTSTPRLSTVLQQLSGRLSTLSLPAFAEKWESDAPNPVNSAEYLKYCMSGQLLARDIGLKPGQTGLLVNGRVIGPLEAGDFGAIDFSPMLAYEKQRRATPILEALKEIGFSEDSMDRTTFADMISTAASIVASVQIPDPSAEGLFNMPQRPRQRQYRHLDSKHSKLTIGDESKALFHFAVLLDPVSETAQKWGALIKWLTTLDSVYLELYLVTDQTREELPLKRFYRSVLREALVFDDVGEEIPAMATFKNLPEEPIYTLSMDVPSSWLVRPRESIHDLDNIHLSALSSHEKVAGVKALFDLDFLVIEGHARDTTSGAPPRGLQLQLTKYDSTPIADTLVMENLGYLQFKAKPGVFQLELKRGRGEDIFTIESVGNAGWDSPPVESEAGAEVTLTSFEGLTLYPRFRRQQGQADADVLQPPRREGFFSSAVQKVVQAVAEWIQPPQESPEADINIFTVASGHLYERFASIMIASVMKNTNSTVKFWFIENFLSPSFLEFIPHLAEEYDFQYELVTYKWPSWLRSQREKQRVIWGYKILFLDVLFPMDLKKVIFVDADQIVRADLQELVDLDLQGAPYGYTPMGDDNPDMEGFRFWKTGYWKDYLRGKPYHISALYVIDLVRFRQLAAGDRLRGHYQQLSADPNSLANLDQDLPNNMQFEVPIFSLDKNWLWCETWCSKDRLDQAKTIDLCQNPLTKEPKLSRARQIPEWSQYDAEIAAFARRLVHEGKIGETALGAEVDALAGEKKSDVPPASSEESTSASPGVAGQEPLVHPEL